MFASYLKYYKISILERVSFRLDFFIRLFTGFFSSYATVAIWYVITSTNADKLSQLTIDRTIKYMILSSILGIVLYAPGRDEVASKVKSGDIARDIVYPVSLPACLFSKGLGRASFAFLTRGLSAFIVLSIIYNIKWSINPIRIGLLLVFTMMGFYINFLISLQVDMLSFWVYETTSLHYIKNSIVSFFSGSMVPLWFYPEQLIKILDILPFKNIIYVPIAFYLGELSASQVIPHLTISLFWCVLFSITTYLLWHRGLKKVVVNGG